MVVVVVVVLKEDGFTGFATATAAFHMICFNVDVSNKVIVELE
jgi:hypothetical protein